MKKREYCEHSTYRQKGHKDPVGRDCLRCPRTEDYDCNLKRKNINPHQQEVRII